MKIFLDHATGKLEPLFRIDTGRFQSQSSPCDWFSCCEQSSEVEESDVPPSWILKYVPRPSCQRTKKCIDFVAPGDAFGEGKLVAFPPESMTSANERDDAWKYVTDRFFRLRCSDSQNKKLLEACVKMRGRAWSNDLTMGGCRKLEKLVEEVLQKVSETRWRLIRQNHRN